MNTLAHRNDATTPLPPHLWQKVQDTIGTKLRLLGILEADEHFRFCIVERAAGPDRTELRRQFGLTEREADVAMMLAERLTNREIARALRVSVHTVRRHVEHILAKLDVHSRKDVRAVLLSATHTDS